MKDSDGTVVIYPDELRGGTEHTICFCVELDRPQQLIVASKISVEGAANLIADFVHENKINILNVAGPRQSEWPEGYDYAFRTLSAFNSCSGVCQTPNDMQALGASASTTSSGRGLTLPRIPALRQVANLSHSGLTGAVRRIARRLAADATVPAAVVDDDQWSECARPKICTPRPLHRAS